MKVKRVAGSNHRVTQGKVYEYNSFNKSILDDKGKDMVLCLSRKGYWEVIGEEEYIGVAIQPRQGYYRVVGEEEHIGETEMSITKIETVTLINNKRSSEYTVELIINLIEDEEQKLKRLGTIDAKSKAIEKLKVKHMETIAALIEVLDSREE